MATALLLKGGREKEKEVYEKFARNVYFCVCVYISKLAFPLKTLHDKSPFYPP